MVPKQIEIPTGDGGIELFELNWLDKTPRVSYHIIDFLLNTVLDREL